MPKSVPNKNRVWHISHSLTKQLVSNCDDFRVFIWIVSTDRTKRGLCTIWIVFFFSSSFTFNGGSITNQHKIQFSFMSKTKQYFYRIQLCQCAFDNAIFEWLLFQVSFSFFGFLFFKFYSFNRNYNKRNKEIWFCIRCTHNRCT